MAWKWTSCLGWRASFASPWTARTHINITSWPNLPSMWLRINYHEPRRDLLKRLSMHIFIYIYISLNVCEECPVLPFFSPSSGRLRPSGNLGLPKAQLSGGLCLQAGWWWGFAKVHRYALPSSTLTAWGLMAPVRAGLACPVEWRGSWSLLVIPPGVFPSPTDLRTSRMVLFCTIKKKKRLLGPLAQGHKLVIKYCDWFMSCTITDKYQQHIHISLICAINYGIIQLHWLIFKEATIKLILL